MKYIITTLILFSLTFAPAGAMTIQEQINELYKMVAELQLQLNLMSKETKEVKEAPVEETEEETPAVEPEKTPEVEKKELIPERHKRDRRTINPAFRSVEA